MFVLAWVARLLSWVGGLASVTWAAAMGVIGKYILALSVLNLVMGILRVVVILGIIFALVNTIAPPDLNLLGLWTTYSGQLGPIANHLGYFFPVDLLWKLIDMYIFVLLLFVVIKSTSFISGLGR